MRGKKAKALRRVIKRQILKENSKEEYKDINLMDTRYEKVQKIAKEYLVFRDGRPEKQVLIQTRPIKLDYCFRRAYQSLKDFVKYTNQVKKVNTRV